MTVGRAWDILCQQKSITAVPVVNDDGTLFRNVLPGGRGQLNMTQVSTGALEEVPLFNVLSVLEGKILNDAGEYHRHRGGGNRHCLAPEPGKSAVFPGK